MAILLTGGVLTAAGSDDSKTDAGTLEGTGGGGAGGREEGNILADALDVADTGAGTGGATVLELLQKRARRNSFEPFRLLQQPSGQKARRYCSSWLLATFSDCGTAV